MFDSFYHDSEMKAAKQEYSKPLRTPIPSTKQVPASYRPLPNTAIVRSVAQGEKPRAPQLRNFMSISDTLLVLNQEYKKPKTPRTVLTTTRSEVLAIDPTGASRMERIALDRHIENVSFA